MKILPAIDLLNGQCVRLYQGDFNQSEQVAKDPFEQLQTFIKQGAEIIHIVDLDGARDPKKRQYPLIKSLVERSTVPIEVGGGIRTMTEVEELIALGVDRIVIGTAAIENPDFLKEALAKYKAHIVVGIDAKNERVATHGWETLSDVDYISFAKEMVALGVETIVFTDISKDGTMTGPSLEQLDKLNKAVSATVVASGGISNISDLQALKAINIKEAIVGKAIYQGAIDLTEAVKL
ncbi:1-(5-phosphoribosyl)-5-[(5-phosphoribosylamino) methylideneamino] imidazole-4-carboxamide isomerase [Halolactibacillus alkaliphilus]|uniref:1-(5-phosphoribosyl)-5-[(5-phosphoribosylamino)methylideneamino] imidazole-4-carboxamide isomerase n=1 Tax=Halolactibacillus alkaliphilus TaxID=442899 RepID=A0A511WZX6_9BACI|nr:1-(5-phosphoribosyl)-5-[(5-phosphoribosylamino)methylideneamino]imidazole-4-carboxamide isomerase [Halolactibacillus alkaliphilus]GEN56248.1 1-(5-phosphoribosyl)-5-[(5-phosphoribosylamino) methylideneamino] imidazole-4-carboxamide isomerase [Halolactibacillus alkaliphilus]GGN66405.1 1-(5-phosphoribosyl)-5-[(5-phosphoribosylamino) methylideneamino] imidazole-4-carboxamide isomerase [Halolactibacillus alkaliphilus]SFO67547.1 1-(5-phosphoribosyl)-5-[(5-phosphoribosylamino)methylideneamino] imida